MWDFSWLERRWGGAGYENWPRVLDELLERGYDSVRIDPYPHLWAAGIEKKHTLLPIWAEQRWGTPEEMEVEVLPALLEFFGHCADRGILVALSSWYRDDKAESAKLLATPEAMSAAWLRILDRLNAEGFREHILYADLCNEFNNGWARFIQPKIDIPSLDACDWMTLALAPIRETFPSLPCTFSMSEDFPKWQELDLSMLDFLELHIWMTHHLSDFLKESGEDYDSLLAKAVPAYERRREHWIACLAAGIDNAAHWSRRTGLPLATTECWAIMFYRDQPGLDWGWVKELCAFGVSRASASGRWSALATSNFCGPQFPGMWNDVAWHQNLTRVIRNAESPL